MVPDTFVSPQRYLTPSLLFEWPVPYPRQWRSHVNQPQTESEVAAIRRSVNRGTPLGSPAWTKRTVKQMGLEVTTHPRGRPKLVIGGRNGS